MAKAKAKAQDVVGRTLVNFSRDGMFPEEDEISAMHIRSSDLPAALTVLASAKLELEDEIRTISRENAPHIDAWIKNATALQDDINRSRKLANDIVREADAADAKSQAAQNAEYRVQFLFNETRYNQQIHTLLCGLKDVRTLLDEAQKLAVDKKILDAVHVLSSAWKAIDKLPVGTSRPRPVQLLDDRAFALRASIHEDFDQVWKSLVNIEEDAGQITISKDHQISALDLDSAITTMQAYKEMEDRAKKLSVALYKVIIAPRIDIQNGGSVSIVVEDDTIRIKRGSNDRTIKSLLKDLETIIVFFNEKLPADFTQALSKEMMPKLCFQIKETWLDSAVPSSLDDMEAFQKAIALVQLFAQTLDSLGWTGSHELHDWVLDSPKIWLTKRRETSLDEIRVLLSSGIGITKRADRTETQTISRTEGKHITTNGDNNEWDAAWSDDEEEQDETPTQLMRSAQKASFIKPGSIVTENALLTKDSKTDSQDDDAVDAWGWGDEDAVEEQTVSAPETAQSAVKEKHPEAVREVTLTEHYTISSMPGPVLQAVSSILDDAATLTQEMNEDNPVTPAAVGLFALPTLILAMYRAVSPYYYSLSPGGNMYLYNDALWLTERLRDTAESWSSRKNLGPRAHGKVNLDNEVIVMEKFGKRGYGVEMSTQRTVITDLLGGARNFLQQEGQDTKDDEIAIDSVVSLIRRLSSDWKQILSRSAWAQATGSLLSTVAKKIILDVEDLSSLGADEAFRVANLISKTLKLDDLFLPDDKNLPQIPTTSQYAPDWLKFHFLSEVLQSDLKDVKYLWFESELSLYFTAEELIELIELSFENNYRTRDAISEIRKNSHPMESVEEEW